jgi:hypothetical protein
MSRLGELAAVLADRVPGEDRQREPDQREADPASGGHVLAEDGDAEGELDDRREVLQQAEGGHRDPGGGAAEEQQRDRGDDTGRHQQQHVPGTLRGEAGLAGAAEPGEVGERERGDQQRLERQALDRTDARGLLRQSVGAEGEREDQRHPRRASVVPGQHHDRDEAEAQRRPLHRPQPLAEEHHAHQHGHQRVDEVAERRLDHARGVHAVDVGAPVGGDRGRGDHQEQRRTPVAEQVAQRAAPPEHDHQHGHHDRRPHDPVGQDLDRAARLQQREVERERAPQSVGRDPEDQAPTRLQHVTSVRAGR